MSSLAFRGGKLHHTHSMTLSNFWIKLITLKLNLFARKDKTTIYYFENIREFQLSPKHRI